MSTAGTLRHRPWLWRNKAENGLKCAYIYSNEAQEEKSMWGKGEVAGG